MIDMATNKGGRPSPWKSSSQTQLIRVPLWMVEDILAIAKIKDANPDVSFIQSQHSRNDSIVQNNSDTKNSFVQNYEGGKEGEIRELIERHKTKVRDTRDWTKAKMIIAELETILGA
jgi:hypothetical protein